MPRLILLRPRGAAGPMGGSFARFLLDHHFATLAELNAADEEELVLLFAAFSTDL